ncbi:hypothetical protein TA3x_005681 [Tundrisphaera sp. TA3]|uniref:hypothetical protein n=1 Tax=Tundrisphaera sp. TA3 TaxID=3435775 RepID=UPI003EB7BEBF
MIEPAERVMPNRGSSGGLHLCVVSVSLLLSLLIAPATVSFSPEGSGALVTLIAVVFGHTIATIAGLCFSKSTKVSCTIVFGIAFFFTGCFAVESSMNAVRRGLYMRYQAPYDRFRDLIASPIPESVANLRIPELDESITDDVEIEFDIDPRYMNHILADSKWVKKDSTELLNPKDFFQYDYYMPLNGDYHIYQQSNSSPGDSILTMKLSAKHDHAIFRREDFSFYRDRLWERTDDIIIKMNTEALEKLKQRYEGSHNQAGK